MMTIHTEGNGMVEWLSVTLRAWDRTKRAVARSEFIDRLSIRPGDPATEPKKDVGGVTRLELLLVELKAFEDEEEPTEAFVAAVGDGLLRAAGWLGRQPVEVFEKVRAAGGGGDLFVGGWIERDQFDLDLPPELLRACGTLGLPISICTND
jgi:hypothetical protein